MGFSRILIGKLNQSNIDLLCNLGILVDRYQRLLVKGFLRILGQHPHHQMKRHTIMVERSGRVAPLEKQSGRNREREKKRKIARRFWYHRHHTILITSLNAAFKCCKTWLGLPSRNLCWTFFTPCESHFLFYIVDIYREGEGAGVEGIQYIIFLKHRILQDRLFF